MAPILPCNAMPRAAAADLPITPLPRRGRWVAPVLLAIGVGLFALYPDDKAHATADLAALLALLVACVPSMNAAVGRALAKLRDPSARMKGVIALVLAVVGGRGV